ncbi:hypothetical protein SDC9_124095 [bioreactor metagenome]|uniref:Uncharacterized protein n=1 Tax=bioreactor metagenome TaxID=1076179 RepID=A0A645CJH1_9ZZZZ
MHSLKKIVQFIHQNKTTLTGMFLGAVLAYIYWINWGIYYGTYPLSSECWVNCIYGNLFGGLLACLLFNNGLKERDSDKEKE